MPKWPLQPKAICKIVAVSSRMAASRIYRNKLRMIRIYSLSGDLRFGEGCIFLLLFLICGSSETCSQLCKEDIQHLLYICSNDESNQKLFTQKRFCSKRFYPKCYCSKQFYSKHIYSKDFTHSAFVPGFKPLSGPLSHWISLRCITSLRYIYTRKNYSPLSVQ